MMLRLMGPIVVLLASALPPVALSDDASGATRPSVEDFAGLWSGALEVGAQTLRLEIEIRIDGGEPSGTLISVDQGRARVALDEVSISGRELAFSASGPGIGFTGTLEDGRIAGRYRQGGFETELVLERGGFEVERQSAADPRDREVAVRSGGVSLAGALRMPDGDGPFPAVVILSGSGRQDRDGTVAGQPLYRALAGMLEARGIASLRLDDRGTGGSDAVAAASPAELAADAAAALETLRAEPEVACAGFLGHSEGGLIALLAAEKAQPRFIVTLAGMHASLEDTLSEQAAAILTAAGAPEQQLERTREIQQAVFAAVRAADGRDAVDEIESALLEIGLEPEGAAGQARQWGSPYAVALFDVDAAAAARSFSGPLLAFFGENDRQVPADSFAARLARQRGDRPTDIRVIEGVDHLFQESATGLPGDYGSAGHPLAPAAEAAIGAETERLLETACGR
jgi:hypothetical protein